jgi:hypothetical protein
MTGANLSCQLTAEETRENGHDVGGGSLTDHRTQDSRIPPLRLCGLYQNLEATAAAGRPTHVGAV